VIVWLRPQLAIPAPQPGRATVQARADLVARLQAIASDSQAPLLAVLAPFQASGQASRVRPLWIVNAIALVADAATLSALAGWPQVAAIRLDQAHHWIPPLDLNATPPGQLPSFDWNLQQVRAPQVWNAFGLTGQGIVVANVDTGVDWLHPALAEHYRGRKPGGLIDHRGNWIDVTEDDYQYPGDGHGHGTHTMGTLVGQGVGVAPGASWIAVKAFTHYGLTYDSWLHAAFQWLLAPGGDPALAPDVVSQSWGGEPGNNDAYLQDVTLLRAAGILPIFAAGNSGPLPESVNYPASYPPAFAVGATDPWGLIGIFSSRGPSPFGPRKPEISAPGVSVYSTIPGGGYARGSGTSMAAPHVGGTAALLYQAQPNLDPDTLAQLITSTATSRLFLGNDPLPNNTFGWGDLDAYSAVATAIGAGRLVGLVRSQSGQPIAGATIQATGLDRSLRGQTTSDHRGGYSLSLGSDNYRVSAQAFGYASVTSGRLLILTDTLTMQDFTLSALPTGVISGQVAETGTHRPLSATLRLRDTPVTTTTDPVTGQYQLAAPTNRYTLDVTAWGHRLVSVPVTITAGTTTTIDLALEPAPTILLVDSGSWYSQPALPWIGNDLTAIGYPFATRPITISTQPPTTTELLPYDLVIWVSPQDSPGQVGASNAISTYLRSGGRLLLTGQDVAFWDGGGWAGGVSPYFIAYMQADFASDAVASNRVLGIEGGAMAGLTATVNTADSARDQTTLDGIRPRTPAAQPLLEYDDSNLTTRPGHTLAGLTVGTCLPYRTLLLSFGLEGVGPTSNRRALLAQAIRTLTTPAPLWDARLIPAQSQPIAAAGTTAAITVTLWNTGQLTDTYDLHLTSDGWPARLLLDATGDVVTAPVTLASCQTTVLRLETTIPADTPRHVSQPLTLSLTSAYRPDWSLMLSVTVKTPAAVLLVDDDRWYPVESAYMQALTQADFPFDHFDTAGRDGPNLHTLSLYDHVVWFTGYDWVEPLSPADEASLGQFLDRGGRLFLSGQDILAVSGLSQFVVDYLGVLTYSNDLTATLVTGVDDGPLGDDLGAYTLTLPFMEWSDVVTPTEAAQVVFVNKEGGPVAISLGDSGEPFRTLFLAFPFEGLSGRAGATVMARGLRWLASGGTVTPTAPLPGDRLTITLWLDNLKSQPVTLSLTATLPFSRAVAYVPGSADQGGWYEPMTQSVRWERPVAAGERLTVQFQADLSLAGRPPVTFRITWDDGSGQVRRRISSGGLRRVWLPSIRK